MAKIITTLHPEGQKKDNLYPNIVGENIPEKSISKNKLTDEFIYEIESIKSGSPSYVGTTGQITSLTSDHGLAVSTSDGNWYYWNGSEYVNSNYLYQSSGVDINASPFKELVNKVGVEVAVGTWTQGQAYNYQNGSVMGDLQTNYQRTNSIRVYPNFKYKYTGKLIALAGIIFRDVNYNFISGINDSYNLDEIIVPSNAAYMYLSNFDTSNPKLFIIGTLDDEIKLINNIMYRKNLITKWIDGYVQNDGTFSSYSGGGIFHRTDYISITYDVIMKTNVDLATDNMSICFYNSNKHFIRAINKNDFLESKGFIKANEGEKYIVLCTYGTDVNKFYLKYYIDGVDNINVIKNIICYGDSITQGMSMTTSNTYPAKLNSYINDENIKVFNCGQGGNDIATILSYIGSSIMKTNKDIVFGSNVTEIKLGNQDNNGLSLLDGAYSTLKPKNNHSNEIYPSKIYIDDYEFGVEMRNAQWISTPQGNTNLIYDYYLTRIDTEALTIPSGKISYYNIVEHLQDYLFIIYVGANGYAVNDKTFTPEEYVKWLKSIKNIHNNTLFIIPTWTSVYDNLLLNEFGLYALDPKEYLCSIESFNRLGLTPTSDDLSAMNQGKIPPSYTVDGTVNNVHLNANGYNNLAYYIYKRLKHLNIV